MNSQKHVQAIIPRSLHTELRMRALQTDSTVGQIVKDAVVGYLGTPSEAIQIKQPTAKIRGSQ